jgi:hypothetical protein
VLVAGGRAGTAPAMRALRAICAHEPRHTLLAHPHPLVAKLGVDAGGAVGLSAAGVDTVDPVEQVLVGLKARGAPVRAAPPQPGVEAAAGDAQHLGEPRDGVVDLLCLR